MRTLLLLAPLLAAAQTGSLVVVGGGQMPPVILDTFFELAGGRDARIVVVPTAGEEADYQPKYLESTPLYKAGARNLVLLHTRDPKVADTPAFAAPLREARGVWFAGGRQWRLADAYLGTRTEREFHALAVRGGVIGGSSAGATIQGSYLVRGAPEGNHIMMAAGHERGFAFLPGAAIDQHLLKRKREKDLVAVVERHPELLGIGIDEGTAIVVRDGRFRVIGASKVAIYENGKAYYFLSPGESFDLRARRRVD